MTESDDYKRGLSTVQVAGVRIVHDGDKWVAPNSTVRVAIAAVAADAERAAVRLSALRYARCALVSWCQSQE